MDKELVEKHFREQLPQVTTFDERLSLLLLIHGQKPGAIVLGVKYGQKERLREFVKDFDVGIKVVAGDERDVLDKFLNRDKRMMKDIVFFSREPERFKILKEEDPGFAGYTHRSVGRFLGYPDTALEYYSETYAPGSEFMDELEEAALREEELRYLNFLSYVPSTRKDQIKEAIQEGKRRAEYLEEKSDGSDIYSEYREKALQKDVI